MKKRLYIFTALLCNVIIMNGQDVHFSLYGEAPSILNPALTGVMYDFRANINYKSQWKSLNSAYSTYAANFETAFKHQKLNKAYAAAGVNFFRDVAGDGKFGTTAFNANISTIISTGKKSKLSVGLSGGATTRKISNHEKLTWENQYDGFRYQSDLPSGEYDEQYSFTRIDFAGGINWHYSESNLYLSSNNGSRHDIGISFYHFNTPANSFFGYGDDKLDMRYNFYWSSLLSQKGSKIGFAPGIIYQKQGPATELIVSTMLKYLIKEQSVHTNNEKPAAFSAGLQYRYRDALIPTFLYEYDKYAIGLAYDFNLSNLSTASKSKGGLEFCLRYNWNPGYGKMIGGSWWGSSHSTSAQ